MAGAEGTKIFDFDNPRSLEKAFREKNYIENYFFLLKSTKSIKTTSQKCWINIIWADLFGRPYRTNGIKARLGLLVNFYVIHCLWKIWIWNYNGII